MSTLRIPFQLDRKPSTPVPWGVEALRRNTSPLTDANDPSVNLLPLVASGDADAVRACIDRYGGLVWSLARRICPSSAEAEDAVQDVFISLWRSAQRFDSSLGSETTFVAMIARRRLIDRVRRNTRGPGMVALEERAAPDPEADSSGDGAQLARTEESAIAQRAIAELPADQQRVLRLSVIHGLSHERIAQATDLPLGTVKTHIRRGLIKVRKLIAERTEGFGPRLEIRAEGSP